MTSAVLGSLGQLKLGDGASPNVFTKIAEVLHLGPVGSSAELVKVTNFDSTAQEYIGGLSDGDEIEFSMNHLTGNAQQETLRDGVGSTKTFQMTWNESPQTTADFSLVIMGYQREETDPETQLKASVSGKITGAIVWS